MEFRIGIHLGDVMVEGERIYGDGVNIAARLEGLAEPGGICISGEIQGQVRHKLDLDCEDLGTREVKNIPEQLNAALLMNQAQVELHKRGAPIILQRHDEFLLEIPEAQLDRWVETLSEVMERPVPELGGAIFPIDISVGKNYGSYHPETNPDGMRELSELPGRGRKALS